MKWTPWLAFYLFWPAIALVIWGELTSHPPDLTAHVWDKALHFTAYFGLSGLAWVALRGGRPGVYAVLALIALGGALEIIQGYVGRDADIHDEIANALGALAGASMGWIFLALLRTRPLVGGSTPD
jgi:VanZ family protein